MSIVNRCVCAYIFLVVTTKLNKEIIAWCKCKQKCIKEKMMKHETTQKYERNRKPGMAAEFKMETTQSKLRYGIMVKCSFKRWLMRVFQLKRMQTSGLFFVFALHWLLLLFCTLALMVEAFFSDCATTQHHTTLLPPHQQTLPFEYTARFRVRRHFAIALEQQSAYIKFETQVANYASGFRFLFYSFHFCFRHHIFPAIQSVQNFSRFNILNSLFPWLLRISRFSVCAHVESLPANITA